MFRYSRVREGGGQEGVSARWALGESTYRSWRKGRGFTGMNCDNGVSWAGNYNMAVGSGPTDTHDGQAAGCLRGVAAAKRCRPVSSGRQFCQLPGLSRAHRAGRKLCCWAAEFWEQGSDFHAAGGWRLIDGYPCSPLQDVPTVCTCTRTQHPLHLCAQAGCLLLACLHRQQRPHR